MADRLATYRAKRNFSRTPEPDGQAGGAKEKAAGARFVVQKHAARRLHYDFRLEIDGVLKSWAVTRGPSLVPGDKRLAVETEDHPLEYGGFEGVIPEGQYGGGTVVLWDQGTWEPEFDAHQGYAKGHLAFTLDGKKLKGGFHLVRMKRRPREKHDSWLLIKQHDAFARDEDNPDILEERPESVASGRSLEEIAEDRDRVWQSNRAETDLDRLAAAAQRHSAATKRTARRPAPPRQAKTEAVPDFIDPMLATLRNQAPAGDDWLHEIKFDGYRLQARITTRGKRREVRLLTRNGLDWTDRFAGIARALANLPVTSALLDGEAVVETAAGVSDFSALQQALSAGRTDHLVYCAFDLLHLDGRNLRSLPLDERKALLDRLLADAVPPLRYSEHIVGDGDAMAQHACRLGLEGIIAKRRTAPYRSGRGKDWLKVKCSTRQEFVVLGYQPASTQSRAIGALEVGFYDRGKPVFAGGVGTGYTQAMARELWQRLHKLETDRPAVATLPGGGKLPKARWVTPALVVEVDFRGWTGDGLLRHAAFKGIREDKEATDVVRETMPASAGAKKSGAAKGTGRKAAAEGGEPKVAGIRLTHPDRVLWEGQGITKLGLAEYYAEIAPYVLPHLVDRPITLVRCPSGQTGECFYQKHAWRGLHKSIRRVPIKEEDGSAEYVAIDDLTGLIAMVQMGALELHPWGARAGDVEHPDMLTFDLDPAPDVSWADVVAGAKEVRRRLTALKLKSFVKTTGGKGLHVVVPLTPKADWDAAKQFAHDLVEAMAADAPERFTTNMAKKVRQGRIFLDYLRNGRGATAVAAYSPRAREGAPVATPLAWEELGPSIRADHFTVATLPRRLASLKRDPWAGFFAVKQTLPGAAEPARRPRRKR